MFQDIFLQMNGSWDWIVVLGVGVIQSIILLFTAKILWQANKASHKDTSISNFTFFHKKLQSKEIFLIRQKLFRIGGSLCLSKFYFLYKSLKNGEIKDIKKCKKDLHNEINEKIKKQDEGIVKYKKQIEFLDAIENNQDLFEKLETFLVGTIAAELKKSFEEPEQFKLAELIRLMDAMGLLFRTGKLDKEIMLDMYFDVVLKVWYCTFPIILKERMNKKEKLKDKGGGRYWTSHLRNFESFGV